jgi:hypothetical protein
MTSSDYARWGELLDRAAIGEVLSDGEQAFLHGHAESNPVAHAEVLLWASMAEFDGAPIEQADLALADRAVQIVLSERRRVSRGRRSLAWVGGGLLSAAAAVLMLVSSRGGSDAKTARVFSAVVEYLPGEARADGAHIEKGAELAKGSVVEAVTGPVCVAVEPKIHACLASGAKVRLSSIGTAGRRLDLLSGRVAVALDPLPRGERLSVVAHGTWSTAVGTAFTVELVSSAKVQTVVHEGKVAVGAESGGSVVGSHKIGLSHGDDVTVEPLVDHAKTETPEWVALAAVAQRSIEAPVAEAPAAEAPKAEAVPEPSPASVDPAMPSRGALVTKIAPPLASDLLATARQSLRDQRWSDAAAAYQKLMGTYPGSPEARIVAVPLAKLDIDRLGRPAAALPLLDAYIANGGSLVVEAQSARIRAYRSLGRTADELRAIDEFLAAHPSSLEAEQLRERREALRTH